MRSKTEKELLRNFTTGDETLNKHVFGNIPMKVVNFEQKENYLKLQTKKPDGKRQIYEQMLQKLTIMFDVSYSIKDFQQLRMFNLNSD